jgi:heme-degrading monooxygenase HmoA
MAVLTTIVSPIDAATYDQMIVHHEPHLRQQAGFRFHYAQPTSEGWLISEIWDSQEAYAAWFNTYIKPNLPFDVQPTITPIHHTIAS